MSFSHLGIHPALAQLLDGRGLTPLPVQEAGLPVLLAGKSAMLVSRTGSGKTLAYLLPILSRIDPQTPLAQAMVLAPTHELAMQIAHVARDLCRDAGLDIRIQPLIGGVAVARQVDGLKKKPHVLVGSAGRVTHLMGLGKLRLGDVRWLVLDEADRLLVEEGLEHVRRIAADLGPQTRFVFVSATEGPASTRVARGLAPNLETVRVAEERVSPAIRHCFLVCEERDKIEWLRKVVRGLEPRRTLVFVHRGASAERLAERLHFHQLAVADLHGARDKFARQAALEAFRKGQATVLMASDIAARGLDISEVDLVVNLDVPTQSRDYLHRAGRTGRAGAAGMVLSLMTEGETRLARRYAEDLGIDLEAVRLVRGALVPAQGEGAQPLRPGPRPAGPGAARRKERTAGSGTGATAGQETSKKREAGPGPGPRPARKTSGAGRGADPAKPRPSAPRPAARNRKPRPKTGQ